MSGGVVAVGKRAIGHALEEDRDMVAAEVSGLDNGQLLLLISAATSVLVAAEKELQGRRA